jgi:hypothetical protein
MSEHTPARASSKLFSAFAPSSWIDPAHLVPWYLGQHPALIDDEAWTAVPDRLATNATDHRRKADAAEPSLLAGVLIDARGERITPSHASRKAGAIAGVDRWNSAHPSRVSDDPDPLLTAR